MVPRNFLAGLTEFVHSTGRPLFIVICLEYV